MGTGPTIGAIESNVEPILTSADDAKRGLTLNDKLVPCPLSHLPGDG